MKRITTIIFALFLLGSARAATFSVINTDDSDAASVRQVILDGRCPRGALSGGNGPNPDSNKPLKDSGCGNKDKGSGHAGADVLTDVFQKP
jgi:hypothetical protein